MPRRILILQGHPDPAPGHLCRALAAAYAEAATAAGRHVETIDLATLAFPPLTDPEDFERGPVPEALQPAVEAIRACEHLVLVFPLWLGTLPALPKSFLEQVLRPGIAFERKPGFPKPLLTGRSARIVATMGTPPIIYRWWYGGHGIRGIERSILAFSGFRPVGRTLFGPIGGADAAKREGWLATMRELGAAGR